MASQTDIKNLDGETPDDKSRKSSSASSRKPRAPRNSKEETDLKARLTETFTRISEALEARGDDELAAIIAEDAMVMAVGLVSLTRPFKPIRTAVTLFVSFVEPLLAFRRILAVLGRRFAERRMRAQEAQDGMAATQNGEPTYPTPVTVYSDDDGALD